MLSHIVTLIIMAPDLLIYDTTLITRLLYVCQNSVLSRELIDRTLLRIIDSAVKQSGHTVGLRIGGLTKWLLRIIESAIGQSDNKEGFWVWLFVCGWCEYVSIQDSIDFLTLYQSHIHTTVSFL